MRRSGLALAALATAAVPGLRPVQVAVVRSVSERDEGRYQSAIVEDVTGRRWVVRSPLTPAAGAELDRNDVLVRQLGKHLPFKVPAAAGYTSLGAQGRVAVYPYVEGAALELRAVPPGPGLAAAIGRAVAAVHNIPPGLFESCGVPVFDAADHRARRIAELDRAVATGHVPTGLIARWEEALEADALWEFTTVPTHGSLDGSCFLVAFADDDAGSGRVVALTGWERAQVADPADDFAGLVARLSPAARDTVVDSYALARSQRPDGYLVQRARLVQEMRPVQGLVAAVASDETAEIRARAEALRRLDRITSTDDSLVPRTAAVAVGAPPTLAEAAAPGTPDPADDVIEVSHEDASGPVVLEPGADGEDRADGTDGTDGTTPGTEPTIDLGDVLGAPGPPGAPDPASEQERPDELPEVERLHLLYDVPEDVPDDVPDEKGPADGSTASRG